MSLAFKIIFNLAALLLFLRLTKPPELRGQRWIKIPLSIPALVGITWTMSKVVVRGGGGFGFNDLFILLLCIGGLAFVWQANISFCIGDSVARFFYGEANPSAGYRTDYRRAKNYLRDREFELALKATQMELEKDPKSYEGLMIAAAVYEHMKLPMNGITQLDIILNNPDASDAQKNVARSERDRLEQLQKHLQVVNAGQSKSFLARLQKSRT